MGEALLLVQFLQAAITTGLNLMPLLERVSSLIQQRRAEGGGLTMDDLASLLNEGDALEAAAKKQFQDTLADPNTPH